MLSLLLLSLQADDKVNEDFKSETVFLVELKTARGASVSCRSNLLVVVLVLLGPLMDVICVRYS